MSFITIDFETFYDNHTGFKTQTSEEYLRDPRFHVIGVAVKVNDEPAQWFSGSMEETRNWLQQFDWQNSSLLAHNTMFDGAILAWHFGIIPAFYYDTLCMARAIHGVEAGGSLKALTEYYGIGKKGNEVVNALGKTRESFDKEGLERYGAYCCNDVELTFKLFKILHEVRPISDSNVTEIFRYIGKSSRPRYFSEDEYELIDLTLRMYIQPLFKVDDALLVERLQDIQREKKELLGGLMHLLQVGNEEEVRAKLSSNKQFAEILQELGIVVPTKISPTTGKETYALAKKDEGFIALLEHSLPVVQQLCTVRLGTKSTIEESRIIRFIEIGGRNKGWLPIPLKYYGAHTGRWAGLDAVNLHNLPSRDKKKKALKQSIVPPPGHVVVNSDKSQIEARILAWIAGQEDLIQQFRNGEDVYSIFASKIFKRKITKADEIERFVGKTGILGLGYGTGPTKLQHTLLTTPPGADLDISTCEGIVSIYRIENYCIVKLWNECESCLRDIMAWPENKESYWLNDMKGVVEVTPEGFRLPNGLYIRYPNLRRETDSKGRTQYFYDSRRGPQKIWGGSVVENIVQALARIDIGEQMLTINQKYRVALTVHDSIVTVVPETELLEAVKFISKVMSIPPKWGPLLPVACEVSWGPTYGDCLTEAQWEKLNGAAR